MDSKEFRNLQEAYLEVVENQQLDETGKNDARIRDNINRFKGSKSVTYTPPRNWDPEANRGQGATVSPKQAEKRRRKALRQEEVDLYDIILSHLLDEGYAETEEAAEAIMVNMSEDWRESIVGEILDEDSRRMSNKEHTKRVRSNIKSFGSNYTPPSNYDPDANRGQGEVLTRKQIEKKRRKALRQEDVEFVDESQQLDEAEKPFPHEKVKAKQVALRDKGGNALDRRMKMGMAVRRAKEAEKTGGSQRDAGKGWYHAKEDFELWVNALVEEGYDLSDYTWDEMYEFYLDEDAGIISGLAGLALGAKGASYAAKNTKRMRDYPKNFVKGIVDPRTYAPKKKKEQKEEFVGESQEARNNPEKYEREQSKKTAPVRGERTPMPPRGDKRREDFEKWYAQQMKKEETDYEKEVNKAATKELSKMGWKGKNDDPVITKLKPGKAKGGFGVGARKRQGAGRPSDSNVANRAGVRFQ